MIATTFKSFLETIKDLHEAKKFNFESLISFTESYLEATEQQPFPWWTLVSGNAKGKGLVPNDMFNPKTQDAFTLPILISEPKEDGTISVKALEPSCPKCGGDMERKTNPKTNTEFFGCLTCNGGCKAWESIAVQTKVQTPNQEKIIKRVLEIIKMARKVVESHGFSLPIGYRTTAHLAKLAMISGSVDEAWKIWIDGRVSDQERAKFDQVGLPAGSPAVIKPVKNQPSWYGNVKAILDAGLPVFLTGPSGTGKTRFSKWYAKQAKKDIHICVGSGDVSGRELWIARRDAQKGSTKNIPGPATLAATEGDVLLLDEIDGFDSNALLPLNAALNGEEQITVPVLGRVSIDKEMRIIAAANTNGRSRDRTYNARNRLDGAFLNRFACVVKTDYEDSVDEHVALEALKAMLEA